MLVVHGDIALHSVTRSTREPPYHLAAQVRLASVPNLSALLQLRTSHSVYLVSM